MTLREEVLNTLADDGESIVQIIEQLKYFNIPHNRHNVIEMLNILWHEKKITIAYPQNIIIKSLSTENIDDLWFELTDIGKCEWEQIE